MKENLLNLPFFKIPDSKKYKILSFKNTYKHQEAIKENAASAKLL